MCATESSQKPRLADTVQKCQRCHMSRPGCWCHCQGGTGKYRRSIAAKPICTREAVVAGIRGLIRRRHGRGRPAELWRGCVTSLPGGQPSSCHGCRFETMAASGARPRLDCAGRVWLRRIAFRTDCAIGESTGRRAGIKKRAAVACGAFPVCLLVLVLEANTDLDATVVLEPGIRHQDARRIRR